MALYTAAAAFVAVGAAFGASAARQQRSARRRQARAKIVENNVRMRTFLQNARAQDSQFESAIQTRGLGEDSSGFLAGRNMVRQATASEVGLNVTQSNLQSAANRNLAKASRMATYGSIATTIGTSIASFGSAKAAPTDVTAATGAQYGSSGIPLANAGASPFDYNTLKVGF